MHVGLNPSQAEYRREMLAAQQLLISRGYVVTGDDVIFYVSLTPEAHAENRQYQAERRWHDAGDARRWYENPDGSRDRYQVDGTVARPIEGVFRRPLWIVDRPAAGCWELEAARLLAE